MYRVFDEDQIGFISRAQFKLGLKRLGLYADLNDVNLFVKRFDPNFSGVIRFSDFSDALTPKTAQYAKLLQSREPNY